MTKKMPQISSHARGLLDEALIQQWHQAIADRLTDSAVGLDYPNSPKWEGVTLVAVTKYASAEQMLGAFRAGLKNFGESKPVEALQKRATLPAEMEQSITWHFIGNLQRNKVNKVVGYYTLIHSVDTFELLEAIAQRARGLNIIQAVLLQVNISGETSKNGFEPHEAENVLRKAETLHSVRVCGFMTMAPKEATEQQQAEIFSNFQQLKSHLENKLGKKFNSSSMGMSQDYSQALIQGATIVRIGNKLFT
jgi:pyridoxal phosphate enzyme (YggS family)